MSTYSFNPNSHLEDQGQTSAERLELLRAEKLRKSSLLNRALNFQLTSIIGLATLFAIGFFNLSDMGAGDSESVSIDIQVLAKVGFLAVAGIYGAIGVFTDAKVRRLMFSFPLVWMWILFGFYCLGVVNSVMKVGSLASTISIACVLLLTTRLLVQAGVRAVLTILFHALTAFTLFSWFLFLFVPEIGVFAEDIVDGQQFLRMSGMAHSNTLGQFSGLNLVFACLLYRNYGEIGIWRWLVIALALGALFASVSRTSLLATMLTIAVIYRESFLKREYLGYAICLALVGALGFLALAATSDLGMLLESKLAAMSKSGDAEELTTGTGRAEIWAYAIKLIWQQPVFGYGAATSKWFLTDYSLYTHNLVLNVAFSTGVFGGLACILMVFGRISSMIYRPHRIADGLVAFILINGFAENVIFSFLCGLPTIAWIIALSIPVLDDMADEEADALAKSSHGLRGSNRLSSMEASR